MVMSEFDPFGSLEPGEKRIMSAEEYEMRQREFNQRKRMEKEQEEMAKAHAEAERKRQWPIKNNLNYDDKVANEICERISAGELLINICNDPHTPTVRRVNYWLRQNSEFQELFNQAIADRLNIFEEEVVQIADDTARDYKDVIMRNGSTRKQVDPEVIARAKLRVDVRFRHLKAGKPTKWGETSTLITKNDDDSDPANYTPEELERQIADIEKKSKVVKPVK
jgi:hypothetical protein